MRKRLLLSLAGLVLLCAIFLVRAALTAGGPVNRRNYDTIQVGMTEAQVKALLGEPHEDLPPLSYEDIDADEQPSLLLRTSPHTLRYWRSETHMITVVFDPQGRVVGKSYSRDPGISLPRRIIDKLGL